jgi:RNA polymerase sigma-70 factor, ECF subfamily
MADFFQLPSDVSVRVDKFMQFYAQHQRRLYVYLLSLVHNVADAEELLQETSYILWRKFDEFQNRPGAGFAAWACRVGYFEALKFREGRTRGELPLSHEFIERVSDKMTEVSDLLELRGDFFNSCMERLSDPDRELIIRRYAPGGSVRSIAVELGRPARSISKSLMRIRKSLLECIDREMRREEQP